MYFVFMGRSCINARRPRKSIPDAIGYIYGFVDAAKRNGIHKYNKWTIADSAGHVVEQFEA